MSCGPCSCCLWCSRTAARGQCWRRMEWECGRCSSRPNGHHNETRPSATFALLVVVPPPLLRSRAGGAAALLPPQFRPPGRSRPTGTVVERHLGDDEHR